MTGRITCCSIVNAGFKGVKIWSLGYKWRNAIYLVDNCMFYKMVFFFSNNGGIKGNSIQLRIMADDTYYYLVKMAGSLSLYLLILNRHRFCSLTPPNSVISLYFNASQHHNHHNQSISRFIICDLQNICERIKLYIYRREKKWKQELKEIRKQRGLAEDCLWWGRKGEE